MLTRRELLAAVACAAAQKRRLSAQDRAGAAPPRLTPTVCLYSKVLIKIGYIDLPMIVQGLGFDGVDLSVENDGHVKPEKAPYSLMPALEAFTGIGLDVPMLTTDLMTWPDKDAEQILGLSTYIGVPFWRPGHWKFTGPAQVEMQLPLVQRNLATLAQVGRATKMVMGVHNYLDGAEGAAVRDISRVITPVDPHWAGYDFDIGYATIEGGAGGFEPPFAIASTRLKMVTLRDFKWDRPEGAARVPKPCPLGDGVVDFPKFFGALAKAKFSGPITLAVDHTPAGEVEAIKHDLAFVRKQLAGAYR